MKKLLFVVLLLLSFISHSQNALQVSYNKTPLKKVLDDIESQTTVQFSYNDSTLSRKQITYENPSIALPNLLSVLTQQTGLTFEKVSESQVLIYVPETTITVCGYVFDIATNEPLSFASILVSGDSKGTISDENGFFQLKKIEKTSQLRIEYVGYRDMVLEAKDYENSNCKNIYVQPTEEALSEVLIVSYLTKGIDKNIDGSLTSDTKNRGLIPGQVEPDVFQGLQSVPGIFSPDESASGFQVRGGSTDQNLVLFDKIKLYNTGHFFGSISIINPYVTETTKVYKGGASVIYGDRISGVIDIRTAEQVPEETSFGLGINGTHIDVFTKARLSNQLAFVASARRSYTDEFQTPTFESFQEKVFQNTRFVEAGAVIAENNFDDIAQREEFFFYDTNAKLIYTPTKNDRITLSGLFTNNNLDYLVAEEEDVISDILSVKNVGATISWEGFNKGKWDHSISGYFTSLDSDYRNDIRDDIDNIVQEENLRRNTIDEFGFDMNATYALNRDIDIRMGYQFSHIKDFYQLFRDQAGDEDIDPDDEEIDPLEELEDGDGDIDDEDTDGDGDVDEDDTGVDEEDIPETAVTRDFNIRRTRRNITNVLYTDVTWRPNRNSHINIGVRAGHNSLVNSFFLKPRLNANYGFSKHFGLKLTLEKRVQSISQLVEFEDTQIRLENRIWTLSDGIEIPNLESLQFSFGAIFSKRGWLIDVDGYVKEIKGLTSFTNGFTSVAEDINVGTSDVIGADVLIKKRIGPGNIWLGYTFNDIKYTFKEIQENSFNGNNDITHNLNVSGSIDFKNWEFSLGYNYHTGAPFTDSESEDDINFGRINGERLPSYHRMDASLAWHFALSKPKTLEERAKKIKQRKTFGTFGISVLNILNRKVALREIFRQDVDAITQERSVEQIEQLSLGFTPNATLRFYF